VNKGNIPRNRINETADAAIADSTWRDGI